MVLSIRFNPCVSIISSAFQRIISPPFKKWCAYHLSHEYTFFQFQHLHSVLQWHLSPLLRLHSIVRQSPYMPLLSCLTAPMVFLIFFTLIDLSYHWSISPNIYFQEDFMSDICSVSLHIKKKSLSAGFVCGWHFPKSIFYDHLHSRRRRCKSC